MKKTLATLLLLPLLLTALSTGTTTLLGAEKPDNIISRTYDIKGFKGLDISYSYDVELTKGKHKVEIEVPSYLEPYVVVRERGGILSIGMDNIPKSILRKYRRPEEWVKAYVSMPEITTLSLSGASSIRVKDAFKTSGDVKMELSGAAKVKEFTLKGSDLSLRMSGASEISSFSGEFEEVDIKSSGAAKADLSLRGNEGGLDVSGAGNISLSCDLERLEIEASGGSKIKLSGAVKDIKMSCSGASTLNADKIPVRNYDVRLSGASSCKLLVTKSLKVELSGASSCRYSTEGDVKVDSGYIGRGAELKRLN